jgi:hypothetical protein
MEKHLWDTIYGLWINAKIKPSESTILFLGLVFLRYTEFRCNQAAKRQERPMLIAARSRARRITSVWASSMCLKKPGPASPQSAGGRKYPASYQHRI